MQRQRIIHLTFVTIILSVICFSNSISAQRRKPRATLKKVPLILKVTTPQPTICLGTESISLETVMSNISRQPITIDKNYLWNGSISVFFRHKKVIDGWASGGTVQYPYTGDFLELAPGDKYRESHEFALTEDGKLEDFFNRIGQYTITFRYQANDNDKESAEIRKWLYTKPVISNFKVQIIRCLPK